MTGYTLGETDGNDSSTSLNYRATLNYDHYRATLRVGMPFRTLRVLLATQSVATCIPTQSVGNDNLNLWADLSAMGCEAAPKPVTSVASGTPRRLVSLPVPGRSRTNEASPGP
ncbi:hypothetical protein A250_07293, partial [Pseudomonas syringae pv. actinidiae ICMP 9617]